MQSYLSSIGWPPQVDISWYSVVIGLGMLGIITVLITLAKITYNIFLHPLRRYPGSKFHAATAFPLCWAELQGQAHLMIQKAHEKYGPVVRVSPGELSFMTAPSWTDIYASRQGKPSFPRDSTFFNEMLVDHRTLTMANDKDHARIRGSMAPAFAPRALMQQEPILQQNIDLLIKQLMKLTVDNQIVDLRTWYNYTTFDLLGDLAFGKSFGCLATSTFHEWVQFVLDLFYAAVLLRVVHRFRPLNRVLALLIPRSLMVKRERHSEMAILKVRERIRAQTERPDFIYYMLQAAGKETISPHELEQQASILILAGSETTSVALTYATYLLLQHEPVLRQLRQELRANFQTEADINLLRVNRLSFLHAVLQEVLRLYPPFSNGFPRQTPIQGAVVDGQFIPGNTVVNFHHWSSYRSPYNFRDPNEFIPERWLGDLRFASDNRDAFQPFSVGPRACIAKKFAYDSMKMILARMVWRFKMSLTPESAQWLQAQRSYVSFHPPPLWVKLEAAQC